MKMPGATIGYLFVGAMMLVLQGCRDEEHFFPDPSDPRLPRYSENGNQVGGALINDVAWKTHFEINAFGPVYLGFLIGNYDGGDSVTLMLDGKYVEGKNKNRSIRFDVVLRNITIKKLNDVEALNARTFLLDGHTNSVILLDYDETISDSTWRYFDGTGKIEIKRVRQDTRFNYKGQDGVIFHPLIVAGTFEFSFDTISTNVTSGRFDFLIDNRNFSWY